MLNEIVLPGTLDLCIVYQLSYRFELMESREDELFLLRDLPVLVFEVYRMHKVLDEIEDRVRDLIERRRIGSIPDFAAGESVRAPSENGAGGGSQLNVRLPNDLETLFGEHLEIEREV